MNNFNKNFEKEQMKLYFLEVDDRNITPLTHLFLNHKSDCTFSDPNTKVYTVLQIGKKLPELKDLCDITRGTAKHSGFMEAYYEKFNVISMESVDGLVTSVENWNNPVIGDGGNSPDMVFNINNGLPKKCSSCGMGEQIQKALDKDMELINKDKKLIDKLKIENQAMVNNVVSLMKKAYPNADLDIDDVNNIFEEMPTRSELLAYTNKIIYAKTLKELNDACFDVKGISKYKDLKHNLGNNLEMIDLLQSQIIELMRLQSAYLDARSLKNEQDDNTTDYGCKQLDPIILYCTQNLNKIKTHIKQCR